MSSGARPSSSSLIELLCICFSRALLFSSSGAALTSSSSWRIMLPIRITLAGCSTISVTGRSAPSWTSASTAAPSGPTKTTLPCCSRSEFVWSLMSLVCPSIWPRRIPGVGIRSPATVFRHRAGSCPGGVRPCSTMSCGPDDDKRRTCGDRLDAKRLPDVPSAIVWPRLGLMQRSLPVQAHHSPPVRREESDLGR